MSIGLQALLGGENPSNAGRVFLSGTGAFSPPRVFAHNSAHHQSQRAMTVALTKHAALAYVADNQAR